MTVDLNLYTHLMERVKGIIKNNGHLPIGDLPSQISLATDFPAIVSCYFVKIIFNTNELDDMINNLHAYYKYDKIENEDKLRDKFNELQ